MRAFAANGGNFMRVWLGHASTEIMPARPGAFDAETETALLQIVRLAEELGLKLKFTLGGGLAFGIIQRERFVRKVPCPRGLRTGGVGGSPAGAS